MSQYRRKYKDYWSDDKIQELARKERVDELAILDYVMTGILANRDQNISGIYKIHRESFLTYAGLNLNRATAALEYINKEIPSILQYDFVNHIAYMRNFFKIQAGYKPAIANVPFLIQGFDETFAVAPKFWADFGQYNRRGLSKIRDKIQAASDLDVEKCFKDYYRDEQLEFLVRLVDLKDEIQTPDFQFHPTSFKSVTNFDRESVSL